MNIIFIGTPLFAVPALEKIFHSEHKIKLCITKNNQKNKSPVQICAEKYNIKNLNAHNLTKSHLQQIILAEKPELVIVIAFGLILPENILTIPEYGCFNAHASLLPRWRGAAPVHRAIMNGDKTTGISIIKMNPICDAGDIALTHEIKIEKYTNTTTLQNKLALIAADKIFELLLLIKKNQLILLPQDTKNVTYAEKITAKDRVIDFNNHCTQVVNQIHALATEPAAYFNAEINGKKENIKIIKAEIIEEEKLNLIDEKTMKNCQIITNKNDGIWIKCHKGAIRPIILQRPGRKTNYLKDFLNGLQGATMKIYNNQ